MNTVIRVNTRSRQVTSHPVTSEESRWGGRSFIAHLLLREVPPTCEPTGRRNKLIVASGLLADTNVTTTGQLSIGGKSPLTGGVKECNTGGSAGKRLARLGIRAVVIEDTPAAPATAAPALAAPATDVVVIRARESRMEPGPELKGKPVDETIAALRARYGQSIGILCIGPAGEMMMYGAGLASPDSDALQIRYAARGGLGALMGSKGVKAIVIDDSDSTYRSEPHDPELLQRTSKWMVEALKADPKTENRHLYGTDAILALANASGLLPTRNFSSGQFERAEEIAGERLRSEILARGGEGRAGTSCVPGCVIQCCNVFPDKGGRKTVASIQYENISLLGSNCGIGSLDDIAEMNHLCNQVGVDAIETGAAIGVAMEAGILPFGDAEAAKGLIREIGRGTYLGRILGHGALLAGRVFGVRRIPVIKGQAIPGYDPRALKGNGVTYVTSPMGADHTAGNAFETLKTLDPLKPAGQVAASRKLQVRAALLDTLGLCLFVRPPFAKKPEMFAALLNGRYGWDMTVRDVLALAHEVIMTEREFNRRAGASEEFHPMPEFMQDEPLPPNDVVFDVPMAEMQTLWDGYEPTDEF